MATDSGNILIVDDNPENLRFLKEIMCKQGHDIRPAISAELALKSIEIIQPDLILLDIKMPKMDGFELCSILKKNKATKKIPIIFLSAMDSIEDKIKAFSVGGIDFISKPFQVQEVLARVDIHLSHRKLQYQMEVQNKQLEQEIVERKQIEHDLLFSKKELEKKSITLKGKLKELKYLYQISLLIEYPGKSLDELLQGIVDLMPASWQLPDITCARIDYLNKNYQTKNYKETEFKLSCNINLKGEVVGIMEVGYFKQKPGLIDGSFFEEDRELIETISKQIEMAIIRNQMIREVQESREVAETANKLKSEFLANMSHELRNPMHHILSYAKFGIDKINKLEKEKTKHYFSQIQTSGSRLLLLLNDLLDLSKLESGKLDFEFEQNSIYAIIKEAVSEVNQSLKEKDITLKIEKPDFPTEIICDYHKIGQVIRNLLSNAIKFTAQSKQILITFCTSHGETDQIPGEGIRVSVIDQGVGIPEEELETIFDKFIQSSKTKSNAGGTGLGLAICKEIIDTHNGRIWANNNADIGTTFSFLLPI